MNFSHEDASSTNHQLCTGWLNNGYAEHFCRRFPIKISFQKNWLRFPIKRVSFQKKNWLRLVCDQCWHFQSFFDLNITSLVQHVKIFLPCWKDVGQHPRHVKRPLPPGGGAIRRTCPCALHWSSNMHTGSSSYRVFFLLVPPLKVLSVEDGKIPTKKVKVGLFKSKMWSFTLVPPNRWRNQ